MQIHDIKRKTKNKKKRYIGRGGRHGKTSGRGTKGQNARAGHRKRPEMRDIIKKIPKKRGYKFASIKDKPAVLNLSAFDKIFKDGDTISPTILADKKIIKQVSGKTQKVKILSVGTISKKLNFVGCTVSAVAKEKIEKAGGTVK